MATRTTISIMVLLFCALSFLSAQDAAGPEVDIAAGPGFPLGEFRDDDEGGARSGFMGSLTGKYRLEPSFGLFAAYVLNVNPLDMDALAESLSDFDPTLDWEVSANAWLANSFLVGPFVSYRSGAIELELLAGLGVTIGRSPELDIDATDGIDTVSGSQDAASAASVGIYVSGKTRYWFNQQLGVFVGFTYLYAEPEFDDVDIELRLNGSLYDSDTTTFDQVFSVLSVPMGLTVKL